MIDTFAIIPAQTRFLWFVIPILAVLLGVGGLVLYSTTAARNARFEVSAEGLRLRGDLYGRLIPSAELRVDEARAVDLSAERALQPGQRTIGTGLPGYRAGWFRLSSGERALVYVTDERHVAYVPTRKGYSVLLSVADPNAFIEALRRVSPGSRGG